MKYVNVNIKASPATEGLAQAVTALQVFTSLTKGEDAPLAKAPEEIKKMNEKLIQQTKLFIAALNELVGTGAEPPSEEQVQQVKDVSDIAKRRFEKVSEQPKQTIKKLSDQNKPNF